MRTPCQHVPVNPASMGRSATTGDQPQRSAASVWQVRAATCLAIGRNLLRSFPFLGLVHRVFILHVLRSCASSLCTPFSFMLSSLHLCFGLHIFRCPPTASSIFSLLLLLQSFSPHGLTQTFQHFRKYRQKIFLLFAKTAEDF